MAHLTQEEFQRAISLLADEIGLQRLRDRFVQRHGLVTRRGVNSAESLADRLYMISAGLRLEAPATLAFHSIWGETLQAKVGEDREKELETLADAINKCLGEREEILSDKETDLNAAVTAYEKSLCAAVGNEMARLDMLLKAVPAVATRLRAAPPVTAGTPE
jgi:hypothetical protein